MKFVKKYFKRIFVISLLLALNSNVFAQGKSGIEIFRSDTNFIYVGVFSNFKLKAGEKLVQIIETKGLKIRQKDSILHITASHIGDFTVSLNTDQGIKNVILISKTYTPKQLFKRWEDERKNTLFPNFNFTLLNGDKINVHKFFKGKLTVINFWFVGCHPCIEEMPNLNELVKKYENNKEVQFFALTFDRKEDVEKCLEKNPFFYTTGILPRPLIDSLHLTIGYPTNYIVDENLNIVDATGGCNFNHENKKCDLKSKYEIIISDYLKRKEAVSISK